MFITEEQARQRLSSPDNLANRLHIPKIGATYAAKSESGRAETQDKEANCWTQEQESQGILTLPARIEHCELRRARRRGPWLSVEERTSIAIQAKASGFGGETRETQREIAERHGISSVAVGQIKSGKGLVDEAAVEQALEAARNAALDKLMGSLGLLSNEKIAKLGAREISHVAVNMARIVDMTMPKADPTANLTVNVYTPQILSEDAFNKVVIE